MDTERIEELLERVKAELGEDRLKEILAEIGPDSEMQKAVDFFHLSFCTSDHSTAECSYYLEGEMVDTWSRPSHSEWVERVQNLLDSYDLNVKDFLAVLSTLTNTLKALIRMDSGQSLLFLDLIGHESIQKTLSKKAGSLEHLSD